ncbi:MAG: hypothetical protein HS126_40005 [Anaerolineales bacterium]|nr:hypothetical protein [Anaerolineales bacterium]
MLIKLGEDVRAQTYTKALRDVDDAIPAYYQLGLTYKELGKLTQAKQMIETAHDIARRYKKWTNIGRTTVQLCRLGDIAVAEDVVMSIDSTLGLDTQVEILCEIALALAEIEQKKRAEYILLDLVNVLSQKKAREYKTAILSKLILLFPILVVERD